MKISVSQILIRYIVSQLWVNRYCTFTIYCISLH
nr:MAG TPA: hypothetical protein [Caudoviricetes sp.]